MKLACLRQRTLAKSSQNSSFRPARLWAVGFATFVVVSVMLAAVPLRAASYSWAVSAGDWSVASNWGGSLLPTSSGTAYVVNGGTVNVTQLGETCGTLSLGSGAGSGTVQMTGGSLSAVSYENVGDSGTGTFTQSGGINNCGASLYLGENTGSSGAYNLNGGLLILSSLSQGSGSAAFNFSGGTLRAGSGFSSNVSMTLSNGGGGATFDTAGYSVTLAGPLSGSGSLTMIGSGALTFTGANTYSGGTTLGNGTLIAGSTGSLGSGLLALNGGTLQGAYDGGGSYTYLPNNILVTATASSTLNAPSGQNLPLSGNLTGSGTLTKIGGYSVFLAGNNGGFSGTYVNNVSNTMLVGSGAGSAVASWVVNGGNLCNTAAGTQAISLGALSGSGGDLGNNDPSNGQVTYRVGALNTSTTFSGSIVNSVGGGGTTVLVKTGSGTLALTGANSYSDGTQINGGVLNFASGSLPISNSNISFGGGTLQWATRNTQDVSSGIAPIAAGQAALIDTNGNSVTFASPLSGPGGLTKTGSGTLNLANSVNSFAGNIVVSGGTLVAGASGDPNSVNPTSSALGNVQLARRTISVNNGATLQFTSGNVFGGAAQTNDIVATPIVIDAGGAVVNAANSNNIVGPVVLSGGTLTSGSGNASVYLAWQLTAGSITVNTAPSLMSGTGSYSGFNMASSTTFNVGATGGPGFDLTVSAPLADLQNNLGSSTLVKIGAGSMLVSNSNNSYSGGTTIGGGVLTFTNGALGGGNVSFSGGTLQYAGGYSDNLGLRVKNSASAIAIDTNGNSVMSSAFDGTNVGGLIKNGAGTLVVGGTCGYLGPTTINAGTLQLGAATGSLSIANSGFETPQVGNGLWTYDTTGGVWNFAGTSGIAADNSQFLNTAPGGTQAAFLQNSSSFSQSISVGVTGIYDLSFEATNRPGYNADNLAIDVDGVSVQSWSFLRLNSGSVFQTFAVGIPLTAGTHTLAFVGASSGGDTTTLIDNISTSANAHGSLPSGGAVSLTGPSAMLDVNGASQVIGSFAGVAGTSILDTGSLTVGDSSSTTFSGSISGAGGSLTKAGSGTLNLGGSNTYTGPTTISQGKLVADGWLTNSAVSVNGGTLGGTGYLSSVTVNVRGTLAPGDPLGVLHLSGNLVLAAGAAMDFDLDGVSTDDELSMPSGSLTFSGQQFSNFGFTWSAGFGPGTYTLVNAKSISGLGSNLSGSIDGLPASLSVSNNDLLLTVVPEPSTSALFGAGVVGLIGWVWQKRSRNSRVTCQRRVAMFDKTMMRGLMAVALVATLLVGMAMADNVILPSGLAPGSEYQIAFVTADFTSGTSGLESYYNSFATTEARKAQPSILWGRPGQRSRRRMTERTYITLPPTCRSPPRTPQYTTPEASLWHPGTRNSGVVLV